MARWNLKVFVVVAVIAMAPMAAMAGKKHDSRRDDHRGSSHSILLKKNNSHSNSHSVWGNSFSFFDFSKNKEKKKLVNYGKFFVGYYSYIRPKEYCPPSETPIPEPTAALLFASGAGVVALRLRGNRR